MFRFPPEGSRAYEACGDITNVVEMLRPCNVGKLPLYRDLRIYGPGEVRRGKDRAVKAIFAVCLRANDDRVLVRVGPRSVRIVWNFGTGR